MNSKLRAHLKAKAPMFSICYYNSETLKVYIIHISALLSYVSHNFSAHHKKMRLLQCRTVMDKISYDMTFLTQTFGSPFPKWKERASEKVEEI